MADDRKERLREFCVCGPGTPVEDDGLTETSKCAPCETAERIEELEHERDAAYRRGLRRAARIAETCAWTHKSTAALGPEQNCVRVAAAIEAEIGEGHD